MAKARVYELAKELGLADEDLLAKLTSMGMTGMTHMSALEEDQVEQIKDEIGARKNRDYVEKRVGSRVIRRRRKTERSALGTGADQEEALEDEGAEEEMISEAAETPAPVEAAETPAEKPESPIQAEPPAAEQERSTAPEEVTKSEPSPKKEAPARIVKPVSQETESSSEEPEPEAASQEEQEEATAMDETTEPEAAAEEAAPEESEPEEQQAAAQQEETGEIEAELETPPTTQPEQEAQAEAEVLKKPSKKAEASKPKKAGAKKLKRKDEPARIIKMPEPEPEERIEEAVETPQRDRKQSKVVPLRPEPETVEKDDFEGRKAKKKKGKKGARTQSREEEAPKRAFGKRKEVVEREDLYDEKPSRAYKGKKGGKAQRKAHKTEVTVPKAIKRRIRLAGDTISVADLSKKMGIKGGEVVKKLFTLGVMANLTQILDLETAQLIASEFDYEIERSALQETEILAPQEAKEENLIPRPPVVTVMGHVDHGKTTLLDAIRETNVVEGEAGGITQHIGAYHVKVGNQVVTFLDTPGHEAFTSMRARGAKVTDIVVLIVAADDGVMQQTKEAIDHSRAAGVPIIVALNKIDKANADIDRVKRELSEYGILTEEWGGDTVLVPISAKKRQGIEELLEYVLLQSEMMELRADPTINARGTVVEARLDRGRGAVATVLVQSGTLKIGDSFICGKASGRVRAMNDDMSKPVEEAGPSIPVEVQGFNGVPMAGDDFIVLSDEKVAKQLAEIRQHEQRVASLSQSGGMTLEQLQRRLLEGEANELKLVIKADVQGSVEALSDALLKLNTPDITVSIIHASTGAISENDIMLASASDAIIVGFNVRPTAKVRQLAEQENVDIRLHQIIYNVIAEIKEAMAGRLAPTYEERVLGQAEVREVFRITKMGTIAGCSVIEGKITRANRARVLREGVVVAESEIDSLKRFKDDVKEVSQGYECGIHIANYNDIKAGDIIESYMLEEIRPTLD